MRLTRVVGMLRELLEPSLGDGSALTFWVVVAYLETLAGGTDKKKKLGDGTAQVITNPPQQMIQSSARPK